MQGLFAALLAPGDPVAADHDVHRAGRARQGVRHLRRHRRRRRVDRPAARRLPHRVRQLALDAVRQPRLRRHRPRRRLAAARAQQGVPNAPKLDLPGTLVVSAGLFALVYGFSHAETAGWANGAHHRLPRRRRPCCSPSFVAHPAARARTRCCRCGSCSTATAAAPTWRCSPSAAGMFAVFLFLTYYLQTSLGYSAVRTGVAFLPHDRRARGRRGGRQHGARHPGELAHPHPGRHADLRRWRMYLLTTHRARHRLRLARAARADAARRRPRPGVRARLQPGDARRRAPATPASPRPRSTPCSRSAARSAPRC